jgi:hypothetical protein
MKREVVREKAWRFLTSLFTSLFTSHFTLFFTPFFTWPHS